jgi:hypothetical protein
LSDFFTVPRSIEYCHVGLNNSYLGLIMSYSILTPYILPDFLEYRKAVNIGDGFIRESMENLMQPFRCKYAFSTREALSSLDIEKINSTKALLLAGANQLNDCFSVAPGVELAVLDKISVPIIPLGIGIHGIEKYNREMSSLTRDILGKMHEKLRFSSWRCPLTIRYLDTWLPEVSEKYLLTGCPVMYGTPILSGEHFDVASDTVVVTVTERGEFWEREIQTIDFVARAFQSSRKVLSLHQDFVALEQKNAIGLKDQAQAYGANDTNVGFQTPMALRLYAIEKGFEIFIPGSVESCWQLYDSCNLHIGSRLHAHLYFLSQAKRSFLTFVDHRSLGFSQLLQFPLCDFRAFDQHMDYDFEIYREACLKTFGTMRLFLNYLMEEVL